MIRSQACPDHPRRIALLALVVLVTACQAEDSFSIGTLTTMDGTPLQASFGQRDSLVVALYDPADCLDCQGLAHQWMAWERMKPSSRRYQIVLSRRASEDEQRHFALQRLEPLVLSELPRGLTVPRAYWVIRSALRDSGIAESGERALLRRVLVASGTPQDTNTRVTK